MKILLFNPTKEEVIITIYANFFRLKEKDGDLSYSPQPRMKIQEYKLKLPKNTMSIGIDVEDINNEE